MCFSPLSCFLFARYSNSWAARSPATINRPALTVFVNNKYLPKSFRTKLSRIGTALLRVVTPPPCFTATLMVDELVPPCSEHRARKSLILRRKTKKNEEEVCFVLGHKEK